MSALQVDPFPGGIGRQQEIDSGVIAEPFFNCPTFFSLQTAINMNDVLITAKKGSDTFAQIVQGVAVLGENNQFASFAPRPHHLFIILQDGRQLLPFLIQAALTYLKGHSLQALQGFNLHFEFGGGRWRLGRRCRGLGEGHGGHQRKNKGLGEESSGHCHLQKGTGSIEDMGHLNHTVFPAPLG